MLQELQNHLQELQNHLQDHLQELVLVTGRINDIHRGIVGELSVLNPTESGGRLGALGTLLPPS